MAIVSIISAKGCSEEKIIDKLSSKLRYDIKNDEMVFDKAATKFNISKSKMEKALIMPSSLLLTSQIEKNRIQNCFKITLLEELLGNDIVYFGFGTLLLPKGASHILKVCIGADQAFRIQNYASENAIEAAEAEKIMRKSDNVLYRIANTLELSIGKVRATPFDPGLYDMMLSADKHATDEIVDKIYKNALADVLKITEQSKGFMLDALLAANVLSLLLDKKHDVSVEVSNGNVMIYVKNYKIRMESYFDKLKELALKVPGVKNAEVSVGTDFNIPSPVLPMDLDRQEKVLLVDDETEFVDALSERLMTRNFKTSVAYSGEEALENMSDDIPDVMILDLKMPGIDGIEVLRRVKKQYPKTEVIILTGHGSNKEEQVAMELGAFAYLEKPIDINFLSTKMKQAYNKILKNL